ncbi:MAG: hypothetical protein A2X48_05525 [Lentisphaerae bacterium GWF2_49_21]|nr:MAG: hypothetical protein A2X48_05525 [Lentisphaerae bacterium GWF2_49_21]
MKITKLFAFFPLVLPIWEKVPFDIENTTVPEPPFYADEASINMQYDYFTRTQDSRLRSKIAVTLSYSNNPVAINLLEKCLENEKNDFVQADILNALYNLRSLGGCKKVSCLKGLLKSPNQSVRALAAALYLKATNDLAAINELLSSENSEYVINFVWNQIISDKQLTKHSRDSDIDKFLSSENYLQRAGALKTAVLRSEEPDKDPRFSRSISDKNIFIKAALASALASRDKGGIGLLNTLSLDKDVSVRAFTASAVPIPERLQVFIKLSADPDEEVRRLACVSLGAFKDAAAIEALVMRIGDKSLQVRTAAERSLIRINPSQEVLKRIGDEFLGDKEARAAAVTILGELNDRRYSAAIEKLLGSLEDSEADLIRRCVYALGSLDYKESWKTVSSKTEHKEDFVRESVASTLGKLKIKDSYETIVKLSDDKVVKVSTQAFESMGWIADSYFNGVLLKAMKKTVAEYPTDNRSYACWSIARINKPNQDILNQLDALCMKMVLKVPMSPNTYDADSVRISALFALIDFGRTDILAKEKAEDIAKAFLSPPKNDSGFASMVGDGLRDYARQAKAYMNNEKVGQFEVKPRSPLFLIEELRKRNEQQPPPQ